MAILSRFTGRNGYDYGTQYIRVERVQILSKHWLEAEFAVYPSQDAAASGQPPHTVEVVGGDFDVQLSEPAWGQAYAALKQRFAEHQDA